MSADDADRDVMDYDFLDFGASKGDCIRFAVERLGGRRGLGIDLSPKKIAAMRKLGFECQQGDITRLNLPDKSVRFVTMSHVLEHLPDLSAVRSAVGNAARLASDFLFIQGPYFDDEEYLAGLGLKFYWFDWRVHTCHLTVSQLQEVLADLGLARYVICGCGSVERSDDRALHAMSSPADQHEHQPQKHPAKPAVRFRRPLHTDFACFVALRADLEWSAVLRAKAGTLLTAPDAGDAKLYRRLHRRRAEPLRRALRKMPLVGPLVRRVYERLRAA